MENKKNIYDISFVLFGKISNSMESVFRPLKQMLVMANMDVDYKKYAAFVVLILFSSFIGFLFLSSIFAILFLQGFILYAPMLVFFSFIVSIGFSLFTYYYPKIASDERKTKIDNQLPFVCLYLSTIAKSGFPPQAMFKMLAGFKNYPVICDEAEKINSDVEVLGFDLPSALKRAIKRSPSPSWVELLSGIRNTITIGGEIGEYLEQKSIGFIQDYKRKLKKFGDTISVFMNIYITVIIVGIVFFIVISSLMTTIGGMSVKMVKSLQMMVVFLGLPMITGGFIVLIKSISPWSK